MEEFGITYRRCPARAACFTDSWKTGTNIVLLLLQIPTHPIAHASLAITSISHKWNNSAQLALWELLLNSQQSSSLFFKHDVFPIFFKLALPRTLSVGELFPEIGKVCVAAGTEDGAGAKSRWPQDVPLWHAVIPELRSRPKCLRKKPPHPTTA